MNQPIMVVSLAAALGSVAAACVQPESQPPAAGQPAAGAPASRSTADEDPAYVLGFTLHDIDGKDQDLAQYKGKVVLIVNVASKCGFTSQYEGLEKLYSDKASSGLVILGFPADNFGHQEPGTNSDVKAFCTSKFGVTFPMFEKISVKGDDQHPLYKKLAGQPAPIGGAPKWNFTKFVVDRSGKVVARFDAKKELAGKPDLEPDLLKKIDELLAAK